jgi:triosephosphate isomerase
LAPEKLQRLPLPPSPTSSFAAKWRAWSESNRRQHAHPYGGSVKPENAEALLNQPEIDGALVG